MARRRANSRGQRWPAIGEVVLATLLVAGRMVSVPSRATDIPVVDWVLLVSLWGAWLYAIRLLRSWFVWGRLPDRVRGWPEWFAVSAWLVLLVVSMFLWPTKTTSVHKPLAVWFIGSSVLGAVTGWLMAWCSLPLARRILRSGAFLWCLIVGVSAGVYAWQVRRYVTGADFYYYLVCARDMIWYPNDFWSGCYAYFPGVYVFWRGMWRATTGDIEWLRLIHVAVVGATGLATGWAVWRGCSSLLLGCVSTLLYWTIASRYEALLGVVEPLATLPVVLALGFWQGRNTERPESHLRLVLLGAAWGVAVWIRQHAGLLALGWIPLVVEWLRSPSRNYRFLGVLFLVPVTATCVLLLGILYEGHGLLPLRLGLTASAAYATRGGFWLNLYHQLRNDEASSLLALVSVASSLVLAGAALAKKQSLTCPQRLSIVAATGALAGLYLFRMREYYHYSMLIVPAILLSQCAVAEAVRRYLVRAQGVWSLWAIMVFYLLVFHYTGGSETTFYYARWRPPDGSPWKAWHEEPAVSADLEKMRSLLADADEKLYVIPPHRIEPYLLWQVRGSRRIGYGFDAPEPEAFPWEEVRYVLVIDSRFDAPSHRAPRHTSEVEELIAELPRRGFRAVCVLPTMTLYERQGP